MEAAVAGGADPVAASADSVADSALEDSAARPLMHAACSLWLMVACGAINALVATAICL